jgi:hypothetical protein
MSRLPPWPLCKTCGHIAQVHGDPGPCDGNSASEPCSRKCIEYVPNSPVPQELNDARRIAGLREIPQTGSPKTRGAHLARAVFERTDTVWGLDDIIPEQDFRPEHNGRGDGEYGQPPVLVLSEPQLAALLEIAAEGRIALPPPPAVLETKLRAHCRDDAHAMCEYDSARCTCSCHKPRLTPFREHLDGSRCEIAFGCFRPHVERHEVV